MSFFYAATNLGEVFKNVRLRTAAGLAILRGLAHAQTVPLAILSRGTKERDHALEGNKRRGNNVAPQEKEELQNSNGPPGCNFCFFFFSFLPFQTRILRYGSVALTVQREDRGS